jgi:hypothetical protein
MIGEQMRSKLLIRISEIWIFLFLCGLIFSLFTTNDLTALIARIAIIAINILFIYSISSKRYRFAQLLSFCILIYLGYGAFLWIFTFYRLMSFQPVLKILLAIILAIPAIAFFSAPYLIGLVGLRKLMHISQTEKE